MTTPIDLDLDDDLFAHIRPANAPRLARLVCPVCEMVHSAPLDAPTRLCGICGGDLDKSAAFIADRVAGVTRACEEALAAYVAAEAGLDEQTASRWERLCAARIDARKGLRWAMYGKFPADMLPEVLAQRRAAAQAAWDKVCSRLAATLADPASPLAPMLDAERVYLEHMKQLDSQRTKLEIAQQEIDVARCGDPLLVRD